MARQLISSISSIRHSGVLHEASPALHQLDQAGSCLSDIYSISSRRPLLSISSNAHALHTQKSPLAKPAVAAAAAVPTRRSSRGGSAGGASGEFAPPFNPTEEDVLKREAERLKRELKKTKVSSTPTYLTD
jgi:hypothetical protein